ncbi:hypothetical protein JOF56_009785 [Kibdelosporangium banguiense]|uniref:Uncharacterized protein n=1 Tax=Kibdelosporangium banguiense TaxID=1365924 RepID=A0ABS4TYD5_9PSEU|nr:hypothetical protein [Kibdelosporangium banguiense]MBP2329400.1 hypothetical protein [Kibdelosporangium banguiense]
MDLEYLTRVVALPFRLGRPEDLPVGLAAVREEGSASARKACHYLTAAENGDTQALLEAARRARRHLGEPAHAPVGADPAESEANRDNDLAFGIVRHHGSALQLLVYASTTALTGILEVAADQGSALDEVTWATLVDGFDMTFGWIADPHRNPRPRQVRHPGRAAPPQPDDALRRWVRGHHVFMVLSQSCSLAVSALTHCAMTDDFLGAEAAAGAATRLMHACRAALRYAGDANEAQYNSEIRPTLMPPVAPPKMSGLHWRDHEALVRVLKSSTYAWRWLGESHPHCVDAFRSALDEAYSAHQGVCRHFVGDQSPSLLATARSTRAATSVLEQFRQIRLQSVPEPTTANPADGSAQ